jgi:hypothetical protein
VLNAAKEIREGRGGEYKEQNRGEIVIRRYDYIDFAIVLKAS